VSGVTRTRATRTDIHLVELVVSLTQLSVTAFLDNGGTANSAASAQLDVIHVMSLVIDLSAHNVKPDSSVSMDMTNVWTSAHSDTP